MCGSTWYTAVEIMGGSGRLAWLILKEDRKILNHVSAGSLRKAAARFSKFPLISSWSVLLRELANQLPAFFFIITYGPGVLGWFMLVQRILEIPLSVIGYSVGNVFVSEVSLLSQQNSTNQIFKLYWQTLKGLTLISLPFMIAVSVISPWAFPFIFGPEWNEAGIYLQILAPMFLLQFLSIPLSNTVYILERQNLQLIRELIRFTMLLVTFLVVKDAGLPALESVKLLSLVGSVSFAVNVIISWIAIKPCPIPAYNFGFST